MTIQIRIKEEKETIVEFNSVDLASALEMINEDPELEDITIVYQRRKKKIIDEKSGKILFEGGSNHE